MLFAIQGDATTLTALVAAFFAGVGSILAWTLKLLKQVRTEGPGRQEVVRMIEKESPYVADRNLILQTLRENQKQIRLLVDTIAKLAASEAHRERRLARLELDLRTLLDRADGRGREAE